MSGVASEPGLSCTLKPELRISDFQYFNWLGAHRPSFHVPAVLNMIKERVSNLNQFCSSEEKWLRKAVSDGLKSPWKSC